MNTRRDKRQRDASREIEITYEGLARVDGSARFSYGDMTSLASVSGPMEVRLAAEQASQATFEVFVRPISNVPATESKAFSSAIRAALLPSLILNRHPRTLIQLVVQALSFTRTQWKDVLIASMINAGSLALLNAGSIPMRGVICAVAVGRLPGAGLVIDPSEEECAYMDAGGSFAFIFAEEVGGSAENVWTSWRSKSGGFTEKDVFEARELARVAAQNVYNAIKTSVSWMGSAEPFELTSTAIRAHGEKTGGEDEDKMEIWCAHVFPMTSPPELSLVFLDVVEEFNVTVLMDNLAFSGIESLESSDSLPCQFIRFGFATPGHHPRITIMGSRRDKSEAAQYR
ncbi:hypothetical protein P691DRAFT_674246 [Macrolepiota fuliginosa MF-IS2]|uniref:Exoribonuclease phosphorolytic domain-containing protein n=1 Tax=Macrolepiota fuliginosa MF-IS2 TaxID=1400762 RepID=A0A9P6C230_9AGAR|nr:hypothetical protein P691DRAFT_674246 [Macrolepiota fuliginosa MF-IS2]